MIWQCQVVPRHYDIVIKTDLQELTFEGTVEIDLDICETVESITLHAAKPITVRSAVLAVGAGESTRRCATSIAVNEERQRITIRFEGGAVAKGQARLGLRFDGHVSSSSRGYFRSSYKRADGSQAYFTLTQMQPIDARTVVPTFDEPALKATFDMTMIHRKGTVALANAPVKSVEELDESPALPRTPLLTDDFYEQDYGLEAETGGDDKPQVPKVESTFSTEWTLTRFETLFKQSTYILAFANGEFEHLEDRKSVV